MWGIIFVISLIAAIAFLIMMVMAEKGTDMRKAGIGMTVVSSFFLLVSGVMWFKNRNANVSVSVLESESESTTSD